MGRQSWRRLPSSGRKPTLPRNPMATDSYTTPRDVTYERLVEMLE